MLARPLSNRLARFAAVPVWLTLAALLTPPMTACYAGGWGKTVAYCGTSKSSIGYMKNPPRTSTASWSSTGDAMGASASCNPSTAASPKKAECSSSGSVTTPFPWQPAGGNIASDPPPKKVMVLETASATWHWNDLPQVTDEQPEGGGGGEASIGEIPANTPLIPSVQGGGKSGQRIKPYDVPPSTGIVTVSCSLSAKANVTAPQSAGGFCSVAVSYTASLSEVRILREGQPITDANNKCLPGEAISLTVTGADPSTPYKWEEPSNKPFKDYNENALDRLQLTKLQTADFSPSLFKYHYTFGDDSKHAIKCTVKVGSKDTLVEDELTIVKPQSEMTPVTGGDVRFTPNVASPTFVGFTGDITDGMTWKSKVWIPTSAGSNSAIVGPHSFCHVQLIAPRRYTKYTTAGNNITIVTDPGNLTTANNKWIDEDFIYDGPYTTGSQTSPMSGTGDSPGADIAPSNWISAILLTGRNENSVENEEFTTYLMFKASSPGSCWVPLRSFDWFWKMKAEYSAPNWSLPIKANTTQPSASETDQHPVWESISG